MHQFSPLSCIHTFKDAFPGVRAVGLGHEDNVTGLKIKPAVFACHVVTNGLAALNLHLLLLKKGYSTRWERGVRHGPGADNGIGRAKRRTRKQRTEKGRGGERKADRQGKGGLERRNL